MNFLIGFEISYNNLNLPTVIYTEGDMGLYYTYLSDGTKIEVCGYDDNEPTRYAGSLVYNDGTFESASFGGGRIVGTNNGANSEVHYFLTDHLGSVRQVVAADGSVIEQNDYYPFGKRWAAVAAPISDNRHRFSGKEEQAFLSLPYVDFGARMYNPDWGRWFTQDPLAEKYYSWAPYCYCINNPVKYVDPNGLDLQLAGTKEEQEMLLAMLQRLTNYKLILHQNGTVTHSIVKTENKNSDYQAGNTLLEQLCDQSSDTKTTTISITDQKSITHPADENAYNGVGSNAEIRFNPNENPSLITQNEISKQVQQEGRPAYIGLAHELIHGMHINSGAARAKTIKLQSITTINGEKYLETLPLEEAITVGLHGVTSKGPTENKIRREHNLNTRIFYSPNFPKL